MFWPAHFSVPTVQFVSKHEVISYIFHGLGQLIAREPPKPTFMRTKTRGTVSRQTSPPPASSRCSVRVRLCASFLRGLSEGHTDGAGFISLSSLICSCAHPGNFAVISCWKSLAAAATAGVDVWSLDPAGHGHLAIRHHSLVEVRLSREFNA